MGGIGKTALAHAAVEELVAAGRFARVLWVTARQQIFAWGRIQQLDRPALTCEELREEWGIGCWGWARRSSRARRRRNAGCAQS